MISDYYCQWFLFKFDYTVFTRDKMSIYIGIVARLKKEQSRCSRWRKKNTKRKTRWMEWVAVTHLLNWYALTMFKLVVFAVHPIISIFKYLFTCQNVRQLKWIKYLLVFRLRDGQHDSAPLPTICSFVMYRIIFFLNVCLHYIFCLSHLFFAAIFYVMNDDHLGRECRWQFTGKIRIKSSRIFVLVVSKIKIAFSSYFIYLNANIEWELCSD